MSKAETAPADGRPTGDGTDNGQSRTPRAHPTPTSTRTNPTSGSVPCHRAGIQIAPAGGPLTADRRKFASWHSSRKHIFTIRYDIQSWTPPTLAPLPREHSPERRRARDIRSGESDRLRVRVVRAMLCGLSLWTLRRNVDKRKIGVSYVWGTKFWQNLRPMAEICAKKFAWLQKKILAQANAYTCGIRKTRPFSTAL